jgi:hypothetical protein
VGGPLVGAPTARADWFVVRCWALWRSFSPARRALGSADARLKRVSTSHKTANASALFTRANKVQSNRVRQVTLLLLVLFALAGCAGGPQALGITGPRDSSLGTTPPPPPGQDPLDSPNTFQSGTRYSPSTGPTTGSGRYWGYN